MKKFLIAEAEKARILGMHYNAMGKTLVNEDAIPDNIWSTYVNASNNAKPGARLITQAPNLLSDEQIKTYKSYDVPFFVNDPSGRSIQVQYQCIDAEPGTPPIFKAGQIYDSNQNLTKIDKELDASGIPWRNMFSWACKPAMPILAARKAKEQPQAQVAGATTPASVAAPNPVSDTYIADREKIRQQGKLNAQQAQQELTNKMADVNYLNPNKEKTELDKDASEVSNLITSASPISGDLLLSVKSRLNKLIKSKPEYGRDPYYLNPATMF